MNDLDIRRAIFDRVKPDKRFVHEDMTIANSTLMEALKCFLVETTELQAKLKVAEKALEKIIWQWEVRSGQGGHCLYHADQTVSHARSALAKWKECGNQLGTTLPKDPQNG